LIAETAFVWSAGVKCLLSDGTTLVSDHYYPDGEGPWPTLLMRQPYGRDIASTVVYAHPVWFARHGYHVAIQDVRGRGGSEGAFYPFLHEGRDGAETIAWLRAHAATNGRIGMYGFSYQGATQLLAAAEQPEGLQCIAPHMTAVDLYHGWFYHHGALRLSSSLGWGIQMLREDARRLGLREASDRLEAAWANVRAQAAHVPYGQHAAIADPALPCYVRDWFAHREAGEYWSELDVSTRLDRFVFRRCTLRGGSIRILRDRSRDILRCASMRGATLRAVINTCLRGRGCIFRGEIAWVMGSLARRQILIPMHCC
jgi:putative CocE/NonD family hydrolase